MSATTFGEDGFDVQGFRVREQERATIKQTVDGLLEVLALAETRLLPFSVFREEHRYELAEAKVALHKVLRSVEQQAHTDPEERLRMMDGFVKQGA